MERFLEPCLLMLLLKAPAHGYELLSRLEEFGLDPGQQDPGLLYRTLRRMEEEGSLTSCWDTDTSGPAKRLYRVTEDGEDMLHTWTGVVRRNMRTLQAFLDVYQAHFGRPGNDEDGR
ncbi:MAG: helix-turn-helix transcriptional regulator [Patescibacteria group bacterium]